MPEGKEVPLDWPQLAFPGATWWWCWHLTGSGIAKPWGTCQADVRGDCFKILQHLQRLKLVDDIMHRQCFESFPFQITRIVCQLGFACLYTARLFRWIADDDKYFHVTRWKAWAGGEYASGEPRFYAQVCQSGTYAVLVTCCRPRCVLKRDRYAMEMWYNCVAGMLATTGINSTWVSHAQPAIDIGMMPWFFPKPT